MFTIFKHTLAVFAVIAVAAAPSAAYAGVELNPLPTATTQPVTSPGIAPAVNSCSAVCSGAGSGAASGESWQQIQRDAGAAICIPRGVCVSPADLHTQNVGDIPVRPAAAAPQQVFGWGDAGIGAAGMLLLLAGGAAVAITTRGKRTRSPGSGH